MAILPYTPSNNKLASDDDAKLIAARIRKAELGDVHEGAFA